MIKIKLFCSGGMSTSILVQRMKDAANERGIDIQITAHSIRRLEKEIEDCDVVLLGPQVAFFKKETIEMCQPLGISVGDIPGLDYGLGDGRKVLDFTLKLLEEEE